MYMRSVQTAKFHGRANNMTSEEKETIRVAIEALTEISEIRWSVGGGETEEAEVAREALEKISEIQGEKVE